VKLRYKLLVLIAAASLLALAASGTAQAATSYHVKNAAGCYIQARGHGQRLIDNCINPSSFTKVNCQRWTDPTTGHVWPVCELQINSGGDCIDEVNTGGGGTAPYEESCVAGDQQELWLLNNFKMINVYYTRVSGVHQDLYELEGLIQTTPEYNCGASCDWNFIAV
jgi:hypothetical protein